MNKFALIGLGFISDRHISAIKDTGNNLEMACDVDIDKMYKIDNNTTFFVDWEKMTQHPVFNIVDYVSICTPNYLHAVMAERVLNLGKKVICEKPPVFSRDSVNRLLENTNVDNLSVVLQCRYSDKMKQIKESMRNDKQYEVDMVIEIYRDEWYMNSWKNDKAMSGGLLYNIGSHYFDLLTWWFGEAISGKTKKKGARRMEGTIKFDNAKVNWTVAIDAPIDKQKRILSVNGEKINLTQLGFEGLHGTVYKEILNNGGYKLKEFLPTLNLIEKLYGRK
jgi:UDP-N-acetyl-2-amino-2-deoxyglucuronate dehydrogenase